MLPENDIICSLLETPFLRRTDCDKRDILRCNRPKPKLNLRKTVRKGRSKPCQRHFRLVWYTEFEWLCGSEYLQKLFCWPCLLVGIQINLFNKNGFDDILNVTHSLPKHEGGFDHVNSVAVLQRIENRLIKKYINDNGAPKKIERSRLDVAKFNENVQLNRRFMHLPINATIFLSKQEQNFCGNENKKFQELLKLLVRTSSTDIQNHYPNVKDVFSGSSLNTIENEIIWCISDYLQGYINYEIDETPFFSIQVNDISDIVKKSQCSIVSRCVNFAGRVTERFLGFYTIDSNRNAQMFSEFLSSVLEQYKYTTKLVAISFNGACVPSNELEKLEMKIKELAPKAILVNSGEMPLSVVLQQSLKKLFKCRMFFANLYAIPAFFYNSPEENTVVGRHVLLSERKRWSSNSNILTSLFKEWNTLKSAFTLIKNDPCSDQLSIRQSKDILSNLNNTEFSFLALLFYKIFEQVDNLFFDLQKKPFDVNFYTMRMMQFRVQINYIAVTKSCEQIFVTSTARSPVPRTENNQINAEAMEKLFNSYKSLCRDIFDIVRKEVDIRFKNIEFLKFVSLADSSKFEEYSKSLPKPPILNSLMKYFPHLTDNSSRLLNELQILYSDKKYWNLDLQDILLQIHETESKEVFKETYKLFSLILTIPLSSKLSKDEHFSCFERMNNYLRNVISKERLSSMAKIFIEEELLEGLLKTEAFHEDIIDKFATISNQKIDLVYEKLGQASKWKGLRQYHGNSTKNQECSADDDSISKRMKLKNDADISQPNLIPSAIDCNQDNDCLRQYRGNPNESQECSADEDRISKRIKLENDADISQPKLMPSATDCNQDNDRLHFKETSENVVMESLFQDGLQVKLEYGESYETTEVLSSNLVDYSSPVPSCSSASFFNHADTEQNENVILNTTEIESVVAVNDAIENFFLSMSDAVKQLPQELQILAKRNVLHEVTECEMMVANRLSE